MTKIQTIPRNWLVWEWKLDGDALDTSWSGNNGTATNVTYVNTDRWYQGQCWVFDGSSSKIVTWNTSIPSWSSARTYSFFLKINVLPTIWNTMFAFSNWSWSLNNFFWLQLYNNWWVQEVNLAVYWPQLQVIETLPLNTYIHFVCMFDWLQTLTMYKNWVMYATSWWYTSVNTTLTWINIWTYLTGASFFNWNIQSFRTYNRALSQQEIQSLYMEWLRKLWGSGLAPLTDWLVAMFETDWSTPLYNVINWTVATTVWWTATTDIFGNTKAISNPNYTWTSITYTTWYTFENSGTWWTLTTSPTWLSATWINRTTTLSRIFLFSRTLSASEVTTLELLCKNSYPYPF